MLAGYLSGRFRLLDEGSSVVLSRFVYVVAMPALIITSLSRVPVGQFFDWMFIGALGGGMLAIFGLSLLIARFAFSDSLTALGLHALTAMFSSTGYIGLPMVLLIFGDTALVPGIIGAVITGALFLPLGIILAEVDRGADQRGIFWSTLIGVVRSPVLMATVGGLMISASGVPLPTPITTFGQLLGDAFIPCALFAAGLFIASCSVEGEALEIGWLVFVKLLLHPLITWWLAYHVFELGGVLPAIAVLQAALPSGVPVFVLAQQYQTFVTRSGAVIVLSTALSGLTLTILLMYLVP